MASRVDPRAIEIRQALVRNLAADKWLELAMIYDLIERNEPLNAADWAPHNRRGWHEPHWHDLVRRGLKWLRDKGLCEHHEERPATWRLVRELRPAAPS